MPAPRSRWAPTATLSRSIRCSACTLPSRDSSLPPPGAQILPATVAQAIADYTLGCAYAEFQETQKGSIATGKLADLVLLSNDLLTIAREHILTTKAEIIIVGGWVILQAQ